MFRAVNAVQEGAVEDNDFVAVFEKLWSDFEAELRSLPNPSSAPAPPPDPSKIALETLEIVRGLRRLSPPAPAQQVLWVLIRPSGSLEESKIRRAVEQLGFQLEGQLGEEDGAYNLVYSSKRIAGIPVGALVKNLKFAGATVVTPRVTKPAVLIEVE